MVRKTILVLAVFLAFSQVRPAKAAPLAPRPESVKPVATMLQSFHRSDAISVKFRDDLMIRAETGVLTDRNSGALHAAARAVLTKLTGGHWSSPYEQGEANLQTLRQTAQGNLGKAVADLRTQFVFTLPQGADAAKTIDALNALDIVEMAMPLPKPVAPPTPPNFQGNQGYLNPATVGIDAIGMWGFPYNTGGLTVRIADLEYSWNMNHQDLPHPLVIGPSPVDPFNDNNHGTAVLGEICSLDNGWGTKGASYLTGSVYVVGVNTAAGYDVGAAIVRATSAMSPGDVILIEQQFPGPNYPNDGSQFGMVPVEWYQPWYNAIVTAIGNNITVVEAAGNGYQNLDDAVYQTGNGGHWPFISGNDSGAIIVGAGGPPGSPWGDRGRIDFSDYGSRVNMQGWGAGVMTTGYGNAYSTEGQNLWYTNTFNGTSSASPNVASAACLLQDYYKRGSGNHVLTPAQIRSYLVNTGSPQLSGTHPASEHIGPRPNVTAAAAQIDFTPPSPNPMMFSSLPTAIGLDQIQMVSVAATDTQSGPVQYFFQQNDGLNGHDSGWSFSNSYLDINLSPNTAYYYRVKARDSATPPNETAWSNDTLTATFIEMPTGVSFGAVDDHSIQVNALGNFTNLFFSQSGLYFEMVPDVPNSGANTWVQSTMITVSNLNPGTTYTFRLKARNQNGVETLFSAQAGQTTSGGNNSSSCDCNGDGVFELDLDTACFTSVLLGTNPDQSAVARCDLNADGHVDGRDIAAYLQCALGGPQTPDAAMNPNPADNATGITLPVTLQWTAGLNSTSNDVYFGTSQWAVDSATIGSPEYMGNQTWTSYTPTGILSSGFDYYWRIDSRNSVGAHKGQVWKFSTALGQATNPFPFNYAMNIDPNTGLTWTAATGASQHDVYLGTSYSDVDNATTNSSGIYRGRYMSASYFGGMLAAGTTYYWRVDEVANSGDATKGMIWTFTTSGTQLGMATSPNPWNFATGVSIWTSLQWMAGSGAASHDVYLGTDWSSVSNATTMSPEFEGNQISTTWSPMTLMPATTYYWRVDEVASDFNTRTHGEVWQFTTQP